MEWKKTKQKLVDYEAMTKFLENRNCVFLLGKESAFENTITAQNTTYNAKLPRNVLLWMQSGRWFVLA